MVGRIVLVLGDQLAPDIAALKAADPARDLVVMAEVRAEARQPRNHPQKIAFFLAAMRKHAAALETAGWCVAYSRLDDPDNSQTIAGEVLRRAAAEGAREVIVTEPGDWRLRAEIEALPLPVTLLPDDRFFCSGTEFRAWAEGRKQLRMEWFYREMRRRTGLLMEGDRPAGGTWNFDQENRKPAPGGLLTPNPAEFEPDDVTNDVISLVEREFPDHFGNARPFRWATDRAQALSLFRHFLDTRLAEFGPYQDAMVAGDPVLWHAVISPYLNAGLLSPQEVCAAVEAEWRAGRVPIQSAEGFIRQVLGWREFLRGIWLMAGPGYTARNALGHDRALPPVYWGGETKMACMAAAVGQTRDMAYAHHIQRLMVTGNFALLAGIDPAEVHDWYLSVYADALEWVEAPNVIGMSQFADGGMVGSKPYVSSGAYIDRMSDYCGGCAYRVKDRTGPSACPFNLLYWHFLARHRDRFETNPRMAQMYRTWDRMAEDRRATVLAEAEAVLARLDRGAAV